MLCRSNRPSLWRPRGRFVAVKSGETMRNKLLLGTAFTALCLGTVSHVKAATLDDVVARLNALERSNSKLARENAQLRERVNNIQGSKAGVVVASASPKGNPVLHASIAPSPAPERTVVEIGGSPLYSKAPGSNPFIDNTTVTLYGHVDVSGDVFNSGVYDQGTKFGIASNLSRFGIAARHNLEPYGYPGWAAVAQFEALVEVASIPTERGAFGTRDSFVGLDTPWGAIKAGKRDTPYKRSTSPFDPFHETLGDYNSIMGNTGGDIRAEFDARLAHAVWYESPKWNGFRFEAMISPGQNSARDNSNFSFGDFNCPGSSPRGSGSGFPATGLGSGVCTDGSYGNAYSVALTYDNGPFTAIGAYELHERTNRIGDEGTVPLSNGVDFVVPANAVGVQNEWAAKGGAGYKFTDFLGTLQLYGIYESLHREGTIAEFNERTRDGYFVSATQKIGQWDVSASWAHANASPGSPGTGTFNLARTALPANIDATNANDFALNRLDSSADQYAIGTRYHFSKWASWYAVGTYLRNGPGAHYCQGPSGHGYAVCTRDQNNNVVAGRDIKSFTTGMVFDF